ncbi:MAG: NRDE family protein [Bacteroidota bacterium]
MCTVTYLPINEGDFIFTSNRDEDPRRAVGDLQHTNSPGGEKLLLPKDQAGGSWIAVSESGRLACILNGAFTRHKRKPPYRKSRGLILLDFFDWTDPLAFWRDFDLRDIEPFTLLAWQAGLLVEGKWDGKQAHTQVLDHQAPYVWASATLYTEKMRQQREEWWQAFLQNSKNGQQVDELAEKDSLIAQSRQVQKFHLTTGSEDPHTALQMRRPEQGVATVSMTQIIGQKSGFDMAHYDLTRQTLDRKNWPA